ncbi:flavin reductase family protein [Comamonas serinivorans]|nr:flavin reductase family protein [Comamonas serinivorans]
MSHASPPPPFSSQDFRLALGMFATGVTVVSTRGEDGQLLGVTVSSFNSVSLSPPLVLWSLGLQSRRLPTFATCSHFAVNVLSAAQVDLARHFAQSGATWDTVPHLAGLGGAPVLADSLAVFECARRSQHTEGDHLVFIGEVQRCTRHSGTPLLYQGGQFYTETPL